MRIGATRSFNRPGSPATFDQSSLPAKSHNMPGEGISTPGCLNPAAKETMPMNKPHLEFTRVDMNTGWATPPGYPAGIKQKILASDLDENRKMGSRTRLLRFEPGVFTTSPFVHDHWEEVYLVSGDLIVGNDEEGKGGEPFDAPTYACRPPGVHHGPFKSEHGCVLYEIHYYDESKK
jgi:hypothetical protein